MIQVHPSELRGRVEPSIRTAIVAGTAEWMPGHEREGDMRRILADRDRTWAVHRGFPHLSDGELRADRLMWEEQREEPRYSRNPDWAEMVDDCIEDLRVELDRRAQA